MDPLVLKNEHYSFSFYKRTFENIKTCIDRVSATAASEAESNGNGTSTPTLATMTNYKIYCACDLALGLVMSKTQNFLLKDFPVQPSLPGKYYMGKFWNKMSCIIFRILFPFQSHHLLLTTT